MQLVLATVQPGGNDQGNGLGLHSLDGHIPRKLPNSFGSQRVFNPSNPVYWQCRTMDKVAGAATHFDVTEGREAIVVHQAWRGHGRPQGPASLPLYRPYSAQGQRSGCQRYLSCRVSVGSIK